MDGALDERSCRQVRETSHTIVSIQCGYRKKRRAHMLNLAILLEDSAREVPERTAIVCGETRMSYAQLNAATNQVTHGLAQAGIQKGDTVALSCQDNPSFVIAYYGILKAGAAVMPLNILLKTREIAYHHHYSHRFAAGRPCPRTARWHYEAPCF